MDITDYIKLVLETATSLQESQDLFYSIYMGNDINTFKKDNAVNIEFEKAIEKNRLKVIYMTIAFMCSEWECLNNTIWSLDKDLEKHIYGNRPHYKWCTQEIHNIGNVRNCIMHHKGKTDIYEMKIEHEIRKDPKNNKKSEVELSTKIGYRKIDEKYINITNLTLKLKDDDIRYFFQDMNEGLKYVIKKIAEYLSHRELINLIR